MIEIISLPIEAAPASGERARAQYGDRVYVFRWDPQQRKGRHCQVRARGTMNSCLVRFVDDGYTMVTSRNAIKKWQLRSDSRSNLIQTRQALAPLRGTDNSRAAVAKVIVQGIDEALQRPGALDDVTSLMRDNMKRFKDPTIDAFSAAPMSPAEIFDAIVPETPDDGTR